MSFDHLQSLIKTTKCPVSVVLAPAEKETAETFQPFALSLIDTLRGVVPALQFPLGNYIRLGWRGLKTLEELLTHAKKQGLFTILDTPLCQVPPSPLPDFSADCIIISGYLGADILRPVLEAGKQTDTCLFVQAHTVNPSAGELQDLVAGDRLVYQVVGDLAQRLGKNDLGQLGYSRIGIMAEGLYPSDLRSLRKRWEQSFLMVSGPSEDVRYAFDKYGRGAVVSTAAPIQAAREQNGDLSAALTSLKALRDELKQYITIL